MRLSPSGNNLVMAMQDLNEISIIDINSRKRTEVSILSSDDTPDIIDTKTGQPVWLYYCDLELTDKYILALHYNSPFSDVLKQKPHNSTLHIFDYEGNLIGVLPMKHPIFSITYSDNKKMLYALDLDKNLYKYSFPKSIN